MSRVYVGKLSYRAREKDVERFFKGYGKILEVDLKNGYVMFSLFERMNVPPVVEKDKRLFLLLRVNKKKDLRYESNNLNYMKLKELPLKYACGYKIGI